MPVENEWHLRLRAGVGGPKLWRLRKSTIVKTARDFIAVGTAMSGLPTRTMRQVTRFVLSVFSCRWEVNLLQRQAGYYQRVSTMLAQHSFVKLLKSST